MFGEAEDTAAEAEWRPPLDDGTADAAEDEGGGGGEATAAVFEVFKEKSVKFKSHGCQ